MTTLGRHKRGIDLLLKVATDIVERDRTRGAFDRVREDLEDLAIDVANFIKAESTEASIVYKTGTPSSSHVAEVMIRSIEDWESSYAELRKPERWDRT